MFDSIYRYLNYNNRPEKIGSYIQTLAIVFLLLFLFPFFWISFLEGFLLISKSDFATGLIVLAFPIYLLAFTIEPLGDMIFSRNNTYNKERQRKALYYAIAEVIILSIFILSSNYAGFEIQPSEPYFPNGFIFPDWLIIIKQAYLIVFTVFILITRYIYGFLEFRVSY